MRSVGLNPMFEVWYELDERRALVQVCDGEAEAVETAKHLNEDAPAGIFYVKHAVDWDPSMDPGCELK